jgi:hypothetical protein
LYTGTDSGIYILSYERQQRGESRRIISVHRR